jgi:hypothetical protein
MNPTSPHALLPVPPQAPEEPFGLLDLEEPPVAYDLDEAGIVPRDPHHLFFYWESRENGALLLRLFPSRDGLPLPSVDVPLPSRVGRSYTGTPYAGDATHVAGALVRDGVVVAEAPRVRLPTDVQGQDRPAEWMEVRSGSSGEPVVVRRGPASSLGEPAIPTTEQPGAPPPPSSPQRWGA